MYKQQLEYDVTLCLEHARQSSPDGSQSCVVITALYLLLFYDLIVICIQGNGQSDEARRFHGGTQSINRAHQRTTPPRGPAGWRHIRIFLFDYETSVLSRVARRRRCPNKQGHGASRSNSRLQRLERSPPLQYGISCDGLLRHRARSHLRMSQAAKRNPRLGGRDAAQVRRRFLQIGSTNTTTGCRAHG